ncbi:MAG: site-2 protease family protein [Planctomycetota bacterium]|jgi:Zn-dependent protease
MGGWWVHELYQAGQTVELISWIFWVILAIVLHELAHGWAALWQGDDTPKQLGRMTLNPLVHMGGASLLVFALIGIAWGVMPTDPSRYRWGRRGRIFVAAAGPGMNIALGLVALTAQVVWLRFGPTDQTIYGNLATFLWIGGWLNLVLAAFNLLPVPPLDGSTILSGLSWRAYQLYRNPQAAMYGLFILLAVFFVTDVGAGFFWACRRAAELYTDALTAVVGLPPL